MDPILLHAFNPGPMTGAGNNTYLLPNQETGLAVLIDAGVGDERHLALLDRELRRTGTKLERVLVTHDHPDHIDGVGAMASRHPAARFAKYPTPERDLRHPVAWERLADGDVIDRGGAALVALHTPGHAGDHLAFWHAESRTLFSGDLVVQGGTVLIHWSGGGRVGEYLASLQRIRDLGPSRLLPAHGPAITDPAAIIDAYLTHRRMRERQVLEALGRGHVTVEAIAGTIYDGLAAALVPAARESIRAHLEKLKDEGRVVEEEDRFHPTGR